MLPAAVVYCVTKPTNVRELERGPMPRSGAGPTDCPESPFKRPWTWTCFEQTEQGRAGLQVLNGIGRTHRVPHPKGVGHHSSPEDVWD